MALSAAQRKQQKEAAKRAKAAKAQALARAARLRAQTQERLRAEIDAKAKKERDRLISRYQTQSIWGGGQAARDKANNDLRYNESQRVKRQDAITKAQNKDKPAAKPAGKPAQSDADFDRRYGTNDPRNNLARRETGRTAAPAPRPAGTQPSRPAASRPAAPAAPAKPAAPAAPKERRVSAATANRESGNYGTSRTNNPMIDEAMKARMRQREERDGVGPVKDGARYAADVRSSTQGIGPVKDGNRYASNLRPSTSTPGKKKEDETKKMSIAERMRRRRAGLA